MIGKSNSVQTGNLPRGLLACVSYHRYALSLEARCRPAGQCSSAILCPSDLQAVHDTAQRSGMRLHLADYHLEAARLALTLNIEVHEQTAEQHLGKARVLITGTGYKRRLPDLEYLLQNESKNCRSGL